MKLNMNYKFLFVLFVLGLVGLSYFVFRPTKQNINLQEILNKDNIIPVAILGSGPAGLSAGIYASRSGFKTLIIEGSKPGGQLTETSYVENWPGEKKILGSELMKKIKDQNIGLGVSFLNDTVKDIDFNTWPYALTLSDNKKINALTVVIATGSSPKTLKVTGEKEYWGKGVTTCAVCDAPFYKGKNVVVVGGGDSAAEQALQLSSHVANITMFVRGDKFRASQAMQDRIKELHNLKILFNTEIKKINGNNVHVTDIDVLNNSTNKSENMPIDGVFLAIGHEPNTQLFKNNLNVDKSGYLKVKGRSQETSLPGVFAAGDVEDHVYMQAGVASGDGIKAALDAVRFLHNLGFSPDFAAKISNKYFEVYEAGESKVIEVKNYEELDKEISGSNVPVLLDFWAEHCPTCKHMLPTFESLSKKYGDKMKFIKINTDVAKDIAEKLYILKVPSFIVYKDKQIIARVNEFMDKVQMTAFVEKFI